jgi:hypothetical protein
MLSLRLSALVILQINPLKGIFLPHHPVFTVRYQSFRTRHPLNLVLHSNYPLRGPFVIVFLSLLPPHPSNSFSLLPLVSPPGARIPSHRPQRRRRARSCGGGPLLRPSPRRRWRQGSMAPALHPHDALSLPNSGALEEQGAPAMPPPRSAAAGSCLLPPTTGAPSCRFPRRRATRGSATPPRFLPLARASRWSNGGSDARELNGMAGIGKKDIESGHPLALLYGGRRRDSRPLRGSGAASSLLCGGSGGAREQQGRR